MHSALQYPATLLGLHWILQSPWQLALEPMMRVKKKKRVLDGFIVMEGGADGGGVAQEST
jgi:hypothetical protein